MECTTTKTLAELTPADVLKVYKGKAGKCCCGCSGSYYHNSKHQEAESIRRGYAVDDEDVSDEMVATILKIVQDSTAVEAGGNNFSTTIGTRLYIVYPL